MFGRAFFGARFFGPRYFGGSGAVAAPAEDEGGRDSPRRRRKARVDKPATPPISPIRLPEIFGLFRANERGPDLCAMSGRVTWEGDDEEVLLMILSMMDAD